MSNQHSSLMFNADERLASLRSFRIIRLEESGFSDLVCHYARREFDVALCQIDLVVQETRWFSKLAFRGNGRQPDPRFTMTALAHAPVVDLRRVFSGQSNAAGSGMDNSGPGTIKSAQDRLNAHNALFYAGSAIRTPDGFLLGALSIMDDYVRPMLPARSLMLLESLSSLVGRWLEGGRQNSYLHSVSGLPDNERFMENLCALRIMIDNERPRWSVIIVEVTGDDLSVPQELHASIGKRLHTVLPDDVEPYQLNERHYAVIVDTEAASGQSIERTVHRLLESFAAPFFIGLQPHVVDLSIRVLPLTMEACLTGLPYFVQPSRSVKRLETRQSRAAQPVPAPPSQPSQPPLGLLSSQVTAADDLPLSSMLDPMGNIVLSPACNGGEFMLQLNLTTHLDSGLATALEGEVLYCVNDEMHDVSQTMVLAQDRHFAAKLFEWYVDKALRTLQQSARRHPSVRIMLTLPPAILVGPLHLRRLSEALHRYDIDPERVDLIIDERMLLDQFDYLCHATQDFSLLKTLGCRVIIDNFGSGGTTFEWLSHMPVSGVRLNALFINAATADRQFYETISLLTSIARASGLEVLGKGISTALMRDVMVSLGCERATGHLFGHQAS